MGFLSRLGLISQVQPADPATDWEAKYKAAITDLAAAQEELAALRPDAEKHRAKLARDRNRVRPSRAKAPTKGASK